MVNTEKEILLSWQRCKINYDRMNSLPPIQGKDFIQYESHPETIREYFTACDQLKTATFSERFAALVKAVLEEMPNVELTFQGLAELKKWKARTDAAQERLSLAIEFDIDVKT